MSGPLVIGHRGACGYLPEHTLASYLLAIRQGADYIEPDVVITADGVLIARHENEIGGTTDVADHAEFSRRRRTQTIDGVEVDGWFTEDFTLAEIKTLRARERLPQLRPQSRNFDGQFEIPTLAEILQMLAAVNATRATQNRALIGIYPETKHPSHFQGARLALETPLVTLLRRLAGDAPVLLQSFETTNLKLLKAYCDYPLVQLADAAGGPWDLTLRGEGRSYADLLSPAGLREIARYATVVAVNKELLVPRGAGGNLGAKTALADEVHAAGMQIHAWTFRAENQFLPVNLRSDVLPGNVGDIDSEIHAFLAAGLDGFFTDQPDLGVRARGHYIVPGG